MTSDDHTDEGKHDAVDVRLHTSIGKPGCIVELRDDGQGHPEERDMEHLSESEARELRDKLDSYLGGESGEA